MASPQWCMSLLHIADPLPTPEMYFKDSSGDPRPIRSTSQIENMNRHLCDFVTGTNLSVASFDNALVNFQ